MIAKMVALTSGRSNQLVQWLRACSASGLHDPKPAPSGGSFRLAIDMKVVKITTWLKLRKRYLQRMQTGDSRNSFGPSETVGLYS